MKNDDEESTVEKELHQEVLKQILNILYMKTN